MKLFILVNVDMTRGKGGDLMKIQQPANRISERGLTVWRITGAIFSIILWLMVVAIGVLTYFFDWPIWIVISSSALVLVVTILSIFVFPALRWRRWRYEVREQEIELQHGIFVITRTLVPMIRVQHVETVQGPILRKYRLATIQISTAATQHEIPAVDVKE